MQKGISSGVIFGDLKLRSLNLWLHFHTSLFRYLGWVLRILRLWFVSIIFILSLFTGTQSGSTDQSLAHSMNIYEALVSLVSTPHHCLQWLLEGVESGGILVMITFDGTTRRVWRLIDDDWAHLLHVQFLVSRQKSCHSSHLKSHVPNESNQVQLPIDLSHRFLEKFVSLRLPKTTF